MRGFGLAAVALLILACDQPGGGSTSAKDCITTVQIPTATKAKDGTPAIFVKSISKCFHTPNQHVVTLSLQRSAGKGWVPVGDIASRFFRDCPNLPGAGHDVTCEWIVAPCVDGTYRARFILH